MALNKVQKYFKDKAERYDNVSRQMYWVFSDELLWFTLKKTLNKLNKNFHFLDAGGGTGRWTEKILREYPNSKGVLLDLSDAMLNVARRKLSKYTKLNKLTILQGNFETAKLENNSFDVSIDFHNVLGFTKNPNKFISNMVSFTKHNGYVISLVPNAYHGAYFNIAIGNIKESKKILKEHIGRFTSEMPNINFFTPKSIMNIYRNNGLNNITICGFPNLIYPNFQETQISGQSTSLKMMLSSKTNYSALLSIEKSLLSSAEASSRGNNIYVLGKKH